jgi:Acyl-CoA dehydrogenases
MDFARTPYQEELLAKLKRLVEENVDEAEVNSWYEKNEISGEFGKKFIDAGFGLLGIPEKFGGTPCDMTTLMMVSEEMTRLTGATIPFLSNILTMFDMIEFGTDEQIEKTIGKFKETGKQSIALSISEPEAGSDNNGMLTYASRGANGKVYLNGQKMFVTNGGITPYQLIVAKDDNNDRDNKNMSLWLCKNDQPGISYEPMVKHGQTITPFQKMYLNNVELDEKESLVGERGKGFLSLLANFEIERVLICTFSLGLAQAAIEDAAKWAKERKTFGQPIMKYQLIQERLVDMEVKVQNMRNFIYHTVWKYDNGQSIKLDAQLCKRYCTVAAQQVVDDAMEIFGGRAFTTETRLGRMWRDARGWRFAGGTGDIMVHIAGREVVKKYAN